MIKKCESHLRKVLKDQSGQAIYWALFGLVPMLGMAGLSIDIGHAYVVKTALQTGTNAAALAAGGYAFFSGATEQSEASTFGSYSSENNAVPFVVGAPVATPVCLNMLIAPGGSPCSTATASNNPPGCIYVLCNAVKVTQTATVPTYFLSALAAPPFNCTSCKTLTVSAVAYSSMSGPATPWNVAIVMDATGSMASVDSNASSCPSGASQFQCGLTGIQTLLAGMKPCPAGFTTCTDAQANLHVALFSFPNIRTDLLPIANACAANPYSSPGPLPYTVETLPKPGLSQYYPDVDLIYKQTPPAGSPVMTAVTFSSSYEITYKATDADANGFVSDYYDPTDTVTGGLNPSSSIIQAIGYGGNLASGTTLKTGCLPISYSGIALNDARSATGVAGAVSPLSPPSPPGGTIVNTTDVGEGVTYYAPVLYAAQAALTAESVLHPHAQNAIILLGDGQMNTQWIYFPEGDMLQKPAMANWNTSVPAKIQPNATDCPNTLPTTTHNTTANTCGYDTATSTKNTAALAAGAMTANASNEASTVVGTYPDFLDECQQSIAAAQYAANLGTRVYAVAYGSETKGCSSTSESHADDYTDVTMITLPNTPLVSFSISTISPCITMENIASDSQWFFSDWEVSGSSTSCQSSANPMTSLDDIFSKILASMSTARLLPTNAT
jgi:hypothetical protein